jgi:hypothetical protein
VRAKLPEPILGHFDRQKSKGKLGIAPVRGGDRFGCAAWTFGPYRRPGGAIENAAMTAAALPSIKVAVGPPARSPV